MVKKKMILIKKDFLPDFKIVIKALSQSAAKKILECNDDDPKGEVSFLINKKPHKSGGVTLNCYISISKLGWI